MNAFQVLIDALSLGSQYALIALGIGLVFGVMRMINFAHGDLITVGAYALIVPSAADIAKPFIGALPAPLLVLAIIVIVAGFALLTERFAFRPLRRRKADGTSLLISSFAISYLLQSVVLFFYTGRPKSIDIFSGLTQQLEIGGVRATYVDLFTILVSAILLATVVVLMRFTRAGVEIRAAAEDFTMARLLGIKADRVIAIAFTVSGVLAGVVSLLYVSKTGVLDFRMGVPLAIAGFVATVVGGMGSLPGAVLGGFLLGFASTLLQVWLPTELRPARDAFLYGLVIVVLLWRPQGLFVKSTTRERI